MNSEELRLLGEAYSKITESQIVTEAERERQSRQTPITAGGGAPEEDGQVERYREMARERARKKEMQNNSVDLFDIVKGHLMSEGYADTEEAALAIMANMSEEWRQSIVEIAAVQKPTVNNRMKGALAHVRPDGAPHTDGPNANMHGRRGSGTYTDGTVSDYEHPAFFKYHDRNSPQWNRSFNDPQKTPVTSKNHAQFVKNPNQTPK